MRNAAFQLGMDVIPCTDANTEILSPAAEERRHTSAGSAQKDFFIERDGERYAGTHLIVDLRGGERLDDIDYIESVLRECVQAANATLLHIHLHHFTPNNGVSGVAVLAESHISVHTWPEHAFAAFDVFMCGDADPQKAVAVLRQAFRPERLEVGEHLRGRME